MNNPDYGFVVTRPRADEILNAFNITEDTKLDTLEGMHVTYQGKNYIIFQRDYWFPPSDTSPDGWHFVYAQSPEEVQWEEQLNQEPEDFGLADVKSTIDDIIKFGMIGVGAYLIVNVLGFLKKK